MKLKSSVPEVVNIFKKIQEQHQPYTFPYAPQIRN